jgi:hypothetical protein
MKTCKQLRESEMWLLEEELAWLLEMTEQEIQDYLRPEGGLALDATTRQDVGWVALGIFYWSAMGVTDDKALAGTLSVPRGMVRRARAFIQSLRDDPGKSPTGDETSAPLTQEEPIALYLVARREDANVAWCFEHRLLDAESVAEQLVIPMKAVRHAINELVRAARARQR